MEKFKISNLFDLQLTSRGIKINLKVFEVYKKKKKNLLFTIKFYTLT